MILADGIFANGPVLELFHSSNASARSVELAKMLVIDV